MSEELGPNPVKLLERLNLRSLGVPLPQTGTPEYRMLAAQVVRLAEHREMDDDRVREYVKKMADPEQNGGYKDAADAIAVDFSITLSELMEHNYSANLSLK